ncbi:hypothetical protein EI534_13395 [Pseudomonas frederiksbergensis]|nr:hypothetical protein [Pseudomonas frederiksbergensis]
MQNLWRGSLLVARGLAPVGSRSGPPTSVTAFQQTLRVNGILRLLRSRTGASPLATGKPPSPQKSPIA